MCDCGLYVCSVFRTQFFAFVIRKDSGKSNSTSNSTFLYFILLTSIEYIIMYIVKITESLIIINLMKTFLSIF